MDTDPRFAPHNLHLDDPGMFGRARISLQTNDLGGIKSMNRTTSVVGLAGLILASSVTVDAQDRGEFFDSKNRRHTYVNDERSGKPHRIYPDIDAAELAGKSIDESNVESVSRKALDELQILSRVDQKELALTRARRSRSGMWIVSFNQQHQELPVLGAKYGVTIGRHNTVLSVGGDTYDGIPRIRTEPTISEEEIVETLLAGDKNASVFAGPELVIFPQVSDRSTSFQLAWVASVETEDDARRVVTDAHTGEVLDSRSLIVHASYSRTGTVDGPVYPRNDHDTRADSTFGDLRVEALRLDYGIMDTDETDSDGDYSLSWTSATANHRIISELEGQYVSEVIDHDNAEISHSSATFSTTYTGTHDWTWPSDSQYKDQLNIFFHTNKIARWYDANFFNVNFKVKLEANDSNVPASNIAWMFSGSTPKIEYSDGADGERQADVVYHEYVHAVSYKLHGSVIGDTLQAGALEEGMADYFACTLIDDDQMKGPNYVLRNLDNTKEYPTDYNAAASSGHANGQIPSGSAWDLRLDLGATTADEIVFTALEMDSPRADTFEEFFDNVLLADDDLNGNGTWAWYGCGAPLSIQDLSPNANEIWDAFDNKHGMPSSLLDEDPEGCHNPKPIAAEGVEVFSLVDAIPNPFNPEVTVRVSVERPMELEVSVFNALGQHVRSLRELGSIEPGVHDFVWDGRSDTGRNLASGTYLVRAMLGDMMISRKITLLR